MFFSHLDSKRPNEKQTRNSGIVCDWSIFKNQHVGTANAKYISKVTLDPLPGKDRRGAWGRKDEEYIADFCLVSKRTLTEEEYLVFRNHFLLGADWKLCCRKLDMDRGNFFHTVYRLQQKLGRVFRELEPYGLFPVDDYFHGPSKSVTSCLTNKVVPIRPPLRNDVRQPSPAVIRTAS